MRENVDRKTRNTYTFYAVCLFNDELRLRFLLKRIRMKIISRKFQRLFAKFFSDSARDVICKVPVFAIENAHEKRQDNFSFFFFFIYIILPKHVHMG